MMKSRLLCPAVCAWMLFTGLESTATAEANSHCKLAHLATIPVNTSDSHAVTDTEMNGHSVRLIVDTGAWFSMIPESVATELNLKTYFLPFDLRVTGVGGSTEIKATRVKEFKLAGIPVRDVEFLVGGSDMGAGLLGQNILRFADLEFDLSRGLIGWVRAENCAKTNLAYWTKSGETSSYLDIQYTTPQEPMITGTVFINGYKVRTVFDSGAAMTILSRRVAERAGIKLDGPGVVDGGYVSGVGRGVVKSWVVPVEALEIGSEEIRHTRVRVAETDSNSPDMLLGMDFFLSHHVMIANSVHRIFFTYNGGPVFNLSAQSSATPPADADSAGKPASPGGPPTPATSAAAPGIPNAPSTPSVPTTAVTSPNPAAVPSVSLEEPKDAAGYVRRGTAYAGRRDFARAKADLTRAIELAPGEPNAYYERALVEIETEHETEALADLDAALKLKPDHLPALIARAEMHVDQSPELALTDLAVADRAAAASADVRLRMGYVFLDANRPREAISQFDRWLAAHAADSRWPNAMSRRCLARGELGEDLKVALKDCNLALDRITKSDQRGTSRLLTDRGIVRLRLGDYARAQDDFSSAVKLNDQNAWALYGRGLAQLRRGKASEGKADLDAAAALSADVAASYTKWGIVP